MKKILSRAIYHIGKDSRKKDSLRFNVETSLLESAGLQPGDKIKVEYERSLMRIEKDSTGTKMVSRKIRKTKIVPALDIRGPELAKIFKYREEVVMNVGHNFVEVERLEPVRVLEVGEIDAPKPVTPPGMRYKVGSCFAGAGILDHAAESTGFFQNEYVLDLDITGLEVCRQNRTKSLVICGPIQKVPQRWLPPVDLKMFGIPCQHFSSSGKGDNVTDENTATIVHNIIRQVAWELPKAAVVEEVPRFVDSFAHDKLVRVMNSMGYKSYEDILDAYDFGSIPMRKRYWGIFVKGDVPFTFPRPHIRPVDREKVRKHIKVPVQERQWIDVHTNATFRYLTQGKTNGWSLKTGPESTQIVDLDATRMRCFTAGYYRMRAEGPFLRHPDNPKLISLFTPEEIASFLGISPEYNLSGISKRRLGELLGQSVCVRTAKAILGSLAITLMELDIRAARIIQNLKSAADSTQRSAGCDFLIDSQGQLALKF